MTLSDFIVRLLLRYFRDGDVQRITHPQVYENDREFLLFQWSCSGAVEDLCQYVLNNPHEVRATLKHVTSVAKGVVRGRVRAADTVRLQLRTGNPSLLQIDEPRRSMEDGPNRLLGWTLMMAIQIASRFARLLPPETHYAQKSLASLRLLRSAQRLLHVTSFFARSPSANDIRLARNSRLLVYRRAATAFDLFMKIKRLDSDAVSNMLASALIGPYEAWQQLELALLLAMANSLSKLCGEPVALNLLTLGSADPVAIVGPYALSWQRRAPAYCSPARTDVEERRSAILMEYGIGEGADRPDVVVYRISDSVVLAIGEAKYYGEEDWQNAIRQAVTQLVDYARGYETRQSIDGLLTRSIIAIWAIKKEVRPQSVRFAPWITTFGQMTEGLDDWAQRLEQTQIP